MKTSIFFKTLIVAFALIPMFVSSAYANQPERPCGNIGGLINGEVTITLAGNCVINESVIISGNVTITSGGGNSHTITRGVDGSLIRIKEGAALTLENIIIDGGRQSESSKTNNNGGAPLVFVDNGAMLTMNAGAILQNNTAPNGGGVLVGNGSTFTMNGGKISGNTANIGGGVFMRHGGIFYMNGGTISGNSAQDFGGGVFVNDAGRFTMNDGEISNNTANVVGGGVNVWGGVFTMTGGAICDNTAADGGCVFVYDGAEFNNKIEGSLICDSTKGEIFAENQDTINDNGTPPAIAPVNLLASKLSAGPNPVSRLAGEVTFFHQGDQIRNGKLKVFNASGKLINDVRISDNKAITGNGNDARRAVGSWNLRDNKGRLVVDGTYIVKGDLTTKDGKRENVSLVLGVR